MTPQYVRLAVFAFPHPLVFFALIFWATVKMLR